MEPGIFQQVMNAATFGLEDAAAYLDNIIVCNSRRLDLNFKVIHHAVSTFNLSLKIMESLHSCSILVRNHGQYIFITSKIGREPEMNDCEPNTWVIKLGRLIVSSWMLTLDNESFGSLSDELNQCLMQLTIRRKEHFSNFVWKRFPSQLSDILVLFLIHAVGVRDTENSRAITYWCTIEIASCNYDLLKLVSTCVTRRWCSF